MGGLIPGKEHNSRGADIKAMDERQLARFEAIPLPILLSQRGKQTRHSGSGFGPAGSETDPSWLVDDDNPIINIDQRGLSFHLWIVNGQPPIAQSDRGEC
jgi:hypothetical protein